MGNHDAWFAFGLPTPIPAWMSAGEVAHQCCTYRQLAAELRAVVVHLFLCLRKVTSMSGNWEHPCHLRPLLTSPIPLWGIASPVCDAGGGEDTSTTNTNTQADHEPDEPEIMKRLGASDVRHEATLRQCSAAPGGAPRCSGRGRRKVVGRACSTPCGTTGWVGEM